MIASRFRRAFYCVYICINPTSLPFQYTQCRIRDTNTLLLPPVKCWLCGCTRVSAFFVQYIIEASGRNRASAHCEDNDCLCAEIEHMDKCSSPSGVLIPPLTPCIRFSVVMWHQTQQLDLTNDMSLFSLLTYIDSRIPALNRKENGMQCSLVPADLLSDKQGQR